MSITSATASRQSRNRTVLTGSTHFYRRFLLRLFHEGLG